MGVCRCDGERSRLCHRENDVGQLRPHPTGREYVHALAYTEDSSGAATMNNIHLNEHDANQGAQSKGEFLGMTGNSAWYLRGSAGASIMIVIVLWGMRGLSLLLCLIIGLELCVLSLTYVFMLKNNKPEHYDTACFEPLLAAPGFLELSFGPRGRRSSKP